MKKNAARGSLPPPSSAPTDPARLQVIAPRARRAPHRATLPIGVLVALCIAVFARTAAHGFLIWDDRIFIVGNPLIAHPSLANLGVLWTTPLYEIYAPVTYSLWELLSALVGMRAWAFHLANVALHGLNACLVFALLERLLGRRDQGALVGALLFALHPLQAETVAWASEAKDLLSALFSLLAIHRFLVWRDVHARRAWLQASMAFALALLAKPSAVVVPALLVVIDRGLYRRDWTTSFRGLAAWFLGAGVFMLITATVQPASHFLFYVAPAWLRPAIALDSLSFYLRKLVLPLPLAPDYARSSESLVSGGALAYTWMPAASVGAAAWGLRRKLPEMGVALALFVVALVPVLGLVPFTFQYYSNVADHYVYLGMFGVALGAAAVYRRLPPPGRYVLVPLVLAGLFTGSLVQASYWHDDATLLGHTLSVNPGSVMAHNDLGQILEEEGRFDEALSHYRESVEARPEFLPGLNNIGNVLLKQGRYDESIQYYTDVLGRLSSPAGRTPGAAHMHNNLGVAYLRKNMPNAAAVEFDRAFRIAPDYAQPYVNLASLLTRAGRHADGIAVLRRGLAANPADAGLRAQLELAVASAGP